MSRKNGELIASKRMIAAYRNRLVGHGDNRNDTAYSLMVRNAEWHSRPQVADVGKVAARVLGDLQNNNSLGIWVGFHPNPPFRS